MANEFQGHICNQLRDAKGAKKGNILYIDDDQRVAHHIVSDDEKEEQKNANWQHHA